MGLSLFLGLTLVILNHGAVQKAQRIAREVDAHIAREVERKFRALPSVADPARAYEFLETIGPLGPNDLYALDELARQIPGELQWTPEFDAIRLKAPKIVHTERDKRGTAWIAEPYHSAAKSWIKARQKPDGSPAPIASR